MISKLHIPVYPLNQFIEYFFYYTDFSPVHTLDRFLPDGNVQIIFDLTDFSKYIYDNQTLKEIQSCRKVWFSGFRTVPITIPSGIESEMLIVQFKKGKAHPFINQPLNALTNIVADAEFVLDNDILNLRDKLQETVSVEQKFIFLEQNLIKYFYSKLKENPFVDYMISNIIMNPNTANLKNISGKTGFSQKHIIKLFKENTGVTPKEFLKVIRFQKAVEEIEIHSEINWSALAYDCGYYDQSHFISDFKTFSGFTPTEYLKSKSEFLNYVPVK